MAFLVMHVDKACCCHVEKEWIKQVETVRKEQLWGDVGEEVGEGSRVQRCSYCIKRGMACEWPSVGSMAHLCSQCREHKIPCMVEGEGIRRGKSEGVQRRWLRRRARWQRWQ